MAREPQVTRPAPRDYFCRTCPAHIDEATWRRNNGLCDRCAAERK